MTILEEIIDNKKEELKTLKEKLSLNDLEKRPFFNHETVSLSASLANGSHSGIIAEYKRKSPSVGMLNSSAGIREVTSGYFREGASGISVLTDYRFFGGSLADFAVARENPAIPLLRKDFIIDEFQVIESKSMGADVILLIAAVLSNGDILKFSRLASSIGMEVLLEIHEEKELSSVNQYVSIVGINNRNLKTFEVNTEVSLKMAGKIPPGFLKISESGLSTPQIIKSLKEAGYNGFLIGGKFMNDPDPVRAFSRFIKDI